MLRTLLDSSIFAEQFDQMISFPVTVFHDPACSKSRAVLDLLRARGIAPEIVLYRQTGWTEPRLRALISRMGVSPGEILRRGEAAATSLSAGASDDEIIAAMVAHPILVERPIVETPLGVVVGRPRERVFDVLPALSEQDGEGGVL